MSESEPQSSGPLEAAARELQQHHSLSDRRPRPLPAWSKLDSMSAWLTRARAAATTAEPDSTKAAEWLLDNDYLVQRAVRQIGQDLPPRFYQRLPRLANGEEEGLPRVFALAHGLLRASHLQLSRTTIVPYVQAYQQAAPLTIAELWALPTMLRLACLEMLVAAFARIFPQVPLPFEPSACAAGWIEDTECVARALANLGTIAAIRWKDVFDSTSRVEAILAQDPAAVYPRMDFDTRDRYRKAVEEMAYGAQQAEWNVAQAVLAQARQATSGPKAGHVGYWLLDAGREAFEAQIGSRPSASVRWGRRLLRHAGPLYAAALALTALAAVVPPANYLAAAGAGPVLLGLGILLTLLPASILAVTLVHWLTPLCVPTRVLPKLDFDERIPPDCATVVVVPVLVGAPAEVPALLERLEAHRLANPDPSLRFALLSDLADAPQERSPGDAEVEETLARGVRRLNERYERAGTAPFHLLHRPRLFNPSERCWMGWERKRGKLEQFNDFVVSGDASAFTLQEGETEALHGLRFVVTADADTRLPPGSVNRLAGTLAHPLNQAEFDPATGRVRAGYTLVQPRVEIAPLDGERSVFTRCYAGDMAIDIYSRAVSDVYQDLFGSGIFIGKGIYEVSAFRRSLEGRVPENAVVSHDLFEGAHGRVALASDIVLYEGFPARYLDHARRWHRWVRGDWQLLPWLGRRVADAQGARVANRLSTVERWKIVDNLRRSLIPPGLVALAAAGWLLLPGAAWVWTLLTVSAPGAYLFTDLITGLRRGERRGVLQSSLHRLADHAGRWLLALAFLVQDAAIATDAIVRTLWRLLVTRRHLLEWTTAAQTAARGKEGHRRSLAWRDLWISPAVSALLAAAIVLANPTALPAAAPLLLLWLLAPEIAIWIARPSRRRPETLSVEDRLFLRRIARRTWLYFETFVGPDDHWLPPDNFQETPHPEIAHRTSPTNIGMMFLSSLTAWDLGYVGLVDLAVRLRSGFDSLDRLERYRGHLLNWYDTRRLQPLEPRYVSTVDSGNLAVSLVALKEGCLEAARGPALRHALWDGLADTLALLAEALEASPLDQTDGWDAPLDAAREHIARAHSAPSGWWAALTELREQHYPALEEAIREAVARAEPPAPETLREVQVWLERLHHHLLSLHRDIETLLPWKPLAASPPPGYETAACNLVDLLSPDHPLATADGDEARAFLANLATSVDDAAVSQWLEALHEAVGLGLDAQAELQERLRDLARRAEALAFGMDFRLLFDQSSRLFHIGYSVSFDRLDTHHYDLLASEARLASFFAIAKGDVRAEHWLFLGRPIGSTAAGPCLLSWNGSMFEYLMPRLLLQSDPGTLLGQSDRAAVAVQRRYGDRLGIPWGVSESAFASRDAEHRYQYRAFGVPGLGLRRGLAHDRVVSPYATALALAADPGAAGRNLRKLERLGATGRYGLFEALDFTPERVPAGQRFSAVRAYMAHHQGMALAALGNRLLADALVRRFHADPRVRAVELLLHERVPSELPPETAREEEREPQPPRDGAVPTLQAWSPAADADFPQVLALGNGRLASWISEAGAGGLWWHQQALTRWLPDATRDGHGLWIYLHDEESGATWSASRQPTGHTAADAGVDFHAHLAEFHRRDHGIALSLEVGVAPGDDLEIRRITVTNESGRPRSLRVTSYGEVVLAPAAEDERHPAFSKLFVGSEYLPAIGGLLFERRPRSPRETPPVLLHRLVADEPGVAVTGFEADRRSFLGRNGSLRHPAAVVENLSGTEGWTLDTVMALQLRLELPPYAQRQFAFVTLAAGSRESVLELAERYATLTSLDWALGDAAAEAAREAHRLGLTPDRLPELQALVSLLLYPHSALRAEPSVIAENRLGQPGLWGLGISGDHPILALRVGDAQETGLLRLLIRAHRLWRRRGLQLDLVVLQTGASGYTEPLRERLQSLLQEAGVQELLGRRGGIHLVFADQLGTEQVHLLEAAARVVLDEAQGPLGWQLARTTRRRTGLPLFRPGGEPVPKEVAPPPPRPADLLFDNGIGGFTQDGREYLIHLEPGETTPAPWSNVLANDGFGSIVTEAGLGFTWAVNSGENRLTPWSNDPVTDPQGEALYLRDEESAEIWTPTPQPAGDDTACQIRHGAGYTSWLRCSQGLEQELLVFVPPDDPVKVVRLRLRNRLPRPRRVTATYYAEWLLGALRSQARAFVVSEYDAADHVLLARNAWNPEFAERVAFLAASLPPLSLTTDRQHFLGREGDLRQPAGLLRWDLGDGIDASAAPCAALQVHLDIDAEGTAEVVFLLGQGDDRAEAERLLRHWREPGQVDQAVEALQQHWDRLLGAIQVRTPDPAFDLMVNRWLLHQTIASRLQARAGFHQASGAIGFRDQLQDVLSLLHADPGRARAHLLTCAARQFEEGDVLHWWHPPLDRGVRTRCSDDLLWLPYATGRYVAATGDVSILREEVPFLRAPPLAPDEDDRYARFEATAERYPLLDHCARALERGVTAGRHGLPLIGAGDWNDGLDRVGRQGRGESVWLGWFAMAAIQAFVELALQLGREEVAARWTARAEALRQAIEEAGWDGGWYLRAFDDDGRPWGSAENDECRIDSITQSWAVLSGAAAPERARAAVEAAGRELVREDDRLVRLLWPPFASTPRDPGYIKAYPPGIRENGGQYTHATAWLGLALARLGDGAGAARIFALANPVGRTSSRTEAELYRGEPYVVAADIAGVAPQLGRGGWTWYTGSAGWTWQLGVEGILGLRFEKGSLRVDPCLPPDWGWFEATVRGSAGSLEIRVEDPDGVGRGVAEVRLDDQPLGEALVSLPADGSTRRLHLRLGHPEPEPMGAGRQE